MMRLQPHAAESASAGRCRSYKILLAEDCAADAGLVRVALTEQGLDFQLRLARDGAEAIACIEAIEADTKAPPLDLLLLDLHLPRYAGGDVLRRLRSTERCALTPVVVVSGSDAEEDRATALKHAAHFYFRKPSRASEYMHLGAIVGEILAGRRNMAVGGDFL
jgi:CheY-like chemotaxis protein